MVIGINAEFGATRVTVLLQLLEDIHVYTTGGDVPVWASLGFLMGPSRTHVENRTAPAEEYSLLDHRHLPSRCSQAESQTSDQAPSQDGGPDQHYPLGDIRYFTIDDLTTHHSIGNHQRDRCVFPRTLVYQSWYQSCDTGLMRVYW